MSASTSNFASHGIDIDEYRAFVRNRRDHGHILRLAANFNGAAPRPQEASEDREFDAAVDSFHTCNLQRGQAAQSRQQGRGAAVPVSDRLTDEAGAAEALGLVLKHAATAGERALHDHDVVATRFLDTGSQCVTDFLEKEKRRTLQIADTSAHTEDSVGKARTFFDEAFSSVAAACCVDQTSLVRTLPSSTESLEGATRLKLKDDIKFTSRIGGFVAGMLVAGVMRWVKEIMAAKAHDWEVRKKTAESRGERAEKWTAFGLGILGAVIGCAPFVGGFLSGCIGAAAPFFSAKAKKHYGQVVLQPLFDLTPMIMQLGACIEDSIYVGLAKPVHRLQAVFNLITPAEETADLDLDFVAADICTQLQKTMRHCGYAY